MSGRKQKTSGAAAGPPPSVRIWKFFTTGASAQSAAKSEFEALSDEVRAEFVLSMKRYRDGESRRKDVRNLGGGILELRIRRGNNHFRVLFIICKNCYVALTAFSKNQEQTPKPDLDRAKRRARQWRSTFGG